MTQLNFVRTRLGVIHKFDLQIFQYEGKITVLPLPSPNQLIRSGGWGEVVLKAREEFSPMAVKELGYSGAVRFRI